MSEYPTKTTLKSPFGMLNVIIYNQNSLCVTNVDTLNIGRGVELSYLHIDYYRRADNVLVPEKRHKAGFSRLYDPKLRKTPGISDAAKERTIDHITQVVQEFDKTHSILLGCATIREKRDQVERKEAEIDKLERQLSTAKSELVELES